LANATSLPEVGGEAALYFESGDVCDLAQRMVTLATDPVFRANLAKAGIVQARKFSWAKCAQQTVEVYQETLRSS